MSNNNSQTIPSLTSSTSAAYPVWVSQQNLYRYYYYYGPLSGWRDGRDGLLRALIS